MNVKVVGEGLDRDIKADSSQFFRTTTATEQDESRNCRVCLFVCLIDDGRE